MLQTARTQRMPGRTFGRRGVRPEGAAEDDTWIISVFGFDDEFMGLMDMEIIESEI